MKVSRKELEDLLVKAQELRESLPGFVKALEDFLNRAAEVVDEEQLLKEAFEAAASRYPRARDGHRSHLPTQAWRALKKGEWDVRTVDQLYQTIMEGVRPKGVGKEGWEFLEAVLHEAGRIETERMSSE